MFYVKKLRMILEQALNSIRPKKTWKHDWVWHSERLSQSENLSLENLVTYTLTQNKKIKSVGL